jgi:hypothetical protein
MKMPTRRTQNQTINSLKDNFAPTLPLHTTKTTPKNNPISHENIDPHVSSVSNPQAHQQPKTYEQSNNRLHDTIHRLKHLK